MPIKSLLPILATVGLLTAVNAQAVILVDNFETRLQSTSLYTAPGPVSNGFVVAPQPASDGVFDQRTAFAGQFDNGLLQTGDNSEILSSNGDGVFLGIPKTKLSFG